MAVGNRGRLRPMRFWYPPSICHRRGSQHGPVHLVDQRPIRSLLPLLPPSLNLPLDRLSPHLDASSYERFQHRSPIGDIDERPRAIRKEQVNAGLCPGSSVYMVVDGVAILLANFVVSGAIPRPHSLLSSLRMGMIPRSPTRSPFLGVSAVRSRSGRLSSKTHLASREGMAIADRAQWEMRSQRQTGRARMERISWVYGAGSSAVCRSPSLRTRALIGSEEAAGLVCGERYGDDTVRPLLQHSHPDDVGAQ
ncbi:hypothetical protein C8F01DRAFT_142 [Mycena amicta]|nr:hypothetical protein C8F01DRAFT_142 [Mycena amicta]